MEFRQFRYILTTAREGTISKAAQKLYISQPSLSQLIAGVEKKIGAPLFDRSVTPLRPTAVGSLYLETARRILDLDEEFQQRTDDMLKRSAGRVTVGSSPFRSTYLLSRFLPGFQRDYPQIQVRLRESTTRQLEALAQDGSVDIVLSLAPIDLKQFTAEELFQEELLLALPPDHPLSVHYDLPDRLTSSLPVLPLAALRDTPFIRLHPEQKIHDHMMMLCAKAGFTPQIKLETRSLEAAQSLAGAGLGATLLPDTIIAGFRPAQTPRYAAIDSHPHRRVLIAWRHSRYLSQAARAFIRSLRTFCSRPGPDGTQPDTRAPKESETYSTPFGIG